MNNFRPLLSLLALTIAATPVMAQRDDAVHGLESLRTLETFLPVFPYELTQLGVREGEVRVAISVDKQGKVDDCLAVAYTRPEFARVTVAAIKRWRFEPARYQGQPINAATEVAVKFATEGTVVVSLTSMESLSLRLNTMFNNDSEAFRPRALSELDRIPTPIATPSPGYPERFSKAGASGQVTVDFYIDETGNVRLPSVDVSEDPELAAAAIDALRNWKFEPPTCKGHPVLVRATQQFNFRPLAKAHSTASNG